jgi:hypothetical protein
MEEHFVKEFLQFPSLSISKNLRVFDLLKKIYICNDLLRRCLCWRDDFVEVVSSEPPVPFLLYYALCHLLELFNAFNVELFQVGNFHAFATGNWKNSCKNPPSPGWNCAMNSYLLKVSFQISTILKTKLLQKYYPSNHWTSQQGNRTTAIIENNINNVKIMK